MPAPVTVTLVTPPPALPLTSGVPAVTVVLAAFTNVKLAALPMEIAPVRALLVLVRETEPGLKIELAAKIAVPPTVKAPVLMMSDERLRASIEPALITPRFRVVFS